jgi:uncharacterized membrane protein
MQTVNLFGYTLYNLFAFFIVYAFLGWCLEVAYAAVNSGKFVNRGFLNGPVCPIYGFGVVLVIVCLTPLAENLPALFIGSVLLTSLLEYLTGLILEKVFANKWWDYSACPFNLKGYICLKFSLAWGIACLFVLKIIHPFIYKAIDLIPLLLGHLLIISLSLIFIIDFVTTAASILKFNKRLSQIEEISLSLRQHSDVLGSNISEDVLVLKAKYEELVTKKHYIHSRLLEAFPNMKSKKYVKAFRLLKERHLSIKSQVKKSPK